MYTKPKDTWIALKIIGIYTIDDRIQAPTKVLSAPRSVPQNRQVSNVATWNDWRDEVRFWCGPWFFLILFIAKAHVQGGMQRQKFLTDRQQFAGLRNLCESCGKKAASRIYHPFATDCDQYLQSTDLYRLASFDTLMHNSENPEFKDLNLTSNTSSGLIKLYRAIEIPQLSFWASHWHF